MYEKLIKHMLSDLPTPTPQTSMDQQRLSLAITPGVGTNAEAGAEDHVRVELNYLLEKVQELKEKHYKEQETLLQELHSLKRIQVQKLQYNIVTEENLSFLRQYYGGFGNILQLSNLHDRGLHRAKSIV